MSLYKDERYSADWHAEQTVLDRIHDAVRLERYRLLSILILCPYVTVEAFDKIRVQVHAVPLPAQGEHVGTS